MSKIIRLFIFSLIVLFSVQGTVFAEQSVTDTNIFHSKRDEQFKDQNDWLTIKSSDGGTRIVSKDGKEIMLIDNFGGIYLNGDLFLNNQKINDALKSNVSNNVFKTAFIILFSLVLVLFLSLLLICLKLKKQLVALQNEIKFQNQS